jgi:hypothetical protein
MVEIAEVCKEVELPELNTSPIDFSCKHCGQIINDYGFNLSVFLYGVAFLVGKKLGYVGFTCPRCLNTILIKGDARKIFQQHMRVFSGPDGSYINPNLRYHSSVIYTPAQIEQLSKFAIPNWNCHLTEYSKNNFNFMLATFLDEYPYLEQDYLSSLIPGGEAPIGAFASVWWFKPEDIEKLVEIENKNGVRVFPRYVHKMNWHEKYDAFCWQYKVYNDYLASMKESASESFDRLRDYAFDNDLNLDKLIEAEPDLATEENVEHLEKQSQKYQAYDIQVASRFLDLLVNFNPAPWDIPAPMALFYVDFWKSVWPFKKTRFPADVTELESAEVAARACDSGIKDLANKIRAKITKSGIQEWAVANHQSFIKDYIDLACKSDFSYGYVWELKCRYLKKLEPVLEKVCLEESRYAFFAEGPTWTITYNGKTLRGLRGIGFRYLYYLVANQKKCFSAQNLVAIQGVHPDFIKRPGIDHYSDLRNDRKDISQLSKPKSYHENIISGDSILDMKNERRKLLREKNEAEAGVDPIAAEKAKKNFDEFMEYYREYFAFKGKVKKFKVEKKGIKDRVSINIKRALERIEKGSPEIFDHFKKSLPHLYQDELCYRPNKEIDWYCK